MPVLLGVVLAAILAVVGVTLYLVAQIEDDTAQATETAKTVAATKAVLDLVAARQLKSQDIPGKVEDAVAGMTTLLNETQDALDATNKAIASTNQTLDQTNALLDQAEAAAAQAQQAAAALQSRFDEVGQGEQAATKLQSRLDEVGQGQEALADKLNQELAKIQTQPDDNRESSRAAAVAMRATGQEQVTAHAGRTKSTPGRLVHPGELMHRAMRSRRCRRHGHGMETIRTAPRQRRTSGRALTQPADQARP